MVKLKDDKERIALGALLHDIGKLLNRSTKYANMCEIGAQHPHLSWWFVRNLVRNEVIEEDKYLEELVLKHHEAHYFSKDINLASIEDKHLKKLAYIVARADNYSSSERNEEESKVRPFKKVPLDSIFSTISLEKREKENIKNRYKLEEFSVDTIFPKEFEENSQDELDNLIDSFLDEVKNIKTDSFKVLYTTLLELIKKYCWAIPSDTQKEICDLSLYDHLKTTAAISLATYQYLIQNENENIEKIADKVIKDAKDKEYFLLIAGDISGIQNYIFSLESTEGAAKRIRFRSFFIKLITNTICYRFLEELDLDMSNIVISSSGKFYLLAPNTNLVKEKINKLKKELNEELFKKYSGDLFFNVQYLSLTGDDLGLKFSKKYSKINDLLLDGKRKKYSDEVLKFNFLNEEIYNENSLEQCKICGKRLVKKGNVCSHCERDYRLGELLPKMEKIAFYKEKEDIESDFEFFGIKCKLFRDEEIVGEPFLVQVYDKNYKNKKYPFVKENYGGYTPVNSNGQVMSFEEIAEYSSSKNIGILKGDLDNLGLIMGYGLKIDEIDDENKKLNDITSISRVSTISRMLDIFFSSWIKEKLKSENLCYIVYSGGDDFMIVGPWDKLIDTAKEINRKFKEFVCENEDMTLTCGIALSKAKAPLFYGAKQAQEAESLGKESGKNGIVIFDTYIPWSKFYEVEKMINFFDKNMKQELFSQSFMYRLLKYTEMAEKYFETKNAKYLKYISDFTYDVGRNLKEKIKIAENRREIEILSEYFGLNSITTKKEFLTKYMRVVLNYVVRKNRGDK